MKRLAELLAAAATGAVAALIADRVGQAPSPRPRTGDETEDVGIG